MASGSAPSPVERGPTSPAPREDAALPQALPDADEQLDARVRGHMSSAELSPPDESPSRARDVSPTKNSPLKPFPQRPFRPSSAKVTVWSTHAFQRTSPRAPRDESPTWHSAGRAGHGRPPHSGPPHSGPLSRCRAVHATGRPAPRQRLRGGRGLCGRAAGPDPAGLPPGHPLGAAAARRALQRCPCEAAWAPTRRSLRGRGDPGGRDIRERTPEPTRGERGWWQLTRPRRAHAGCRAHDACAVRSRTAGAVIASG